ncbi:M56 family metallopeptidase [Tautonia sp. JC769]|uniref:M56 family metallopeptidase n=1 Tax=Tautonia sp. JC769 TaxID=3232135 RepID=UPI0034581D8B
MIDLLNTWSAAWAAMTWAIVWQSTILAAVVAVAARGLRGAMPEIRYWLWQAVAIKLMLMPFWVVSVGMPGVVRGPIGAGGGEESAGDAGIGDGVPVWPTALEAEGMPDGGAPPGGRSAGWAWGVGRISWASWALMTWLVGIGAGVVVLARQHAGLSRLLCGAEPMTDRTWGGWIEGAAEALGLRRPPRTLVTPGSGSPFVCGLIRPTLVLPGSLVASLDPMAARRVLVHELAHLKRGDLLWGWIPEIARRIYWFHPVAHLAAARARFERELACDRIAMAHSGRDPVGYARTLVHVVSQGSLASSAGDGGGIGGGDRRRSSPGTHQQERGS